MSRMKSGIIGKNLIVMAAALVLVLGTQGAVVSHASEGVAFSEESQAVSGEVVTLGKDTDALDAPSESGSVAHTFAAGESLFITGEENGYKQIFYQGKTLYLKLDDTETTEQTTTVENADKETVELGRDEFEEVLQDEFDTAATEDKAFVEAYVRLQEAKKKALIWKIVIGVLVVALLVVSFCIGIKNKKAE